jgi:lipoprotein-anchoring transpeptidase ErfK/SrfK
MRSLLAVAAVFAATCVPAAAKVLNAEVDLSDQTLTVVYKGEVLAQWPVSTGRAGFRTPPGEFRPQRMYRDYYSKQYDDAAMPHAIFYDMGYAIHGTYEIGSLGRPASHGCVRLARHNAQMLFDLVLTVGPENTSITVRR